MREWQLRQSSPAAREPAPSGPIPVITLSRELGSGGNEVAQLLQEQLDWHLWDRQLVEEIARSAQVRTSVVESLDERRRSEILDILHELLGDRLGPVGYRRHLAQIILTVALHGSAIIVGRGANWLLPNALNVRIVAPLAQRVARVAAREAISEEEARRRYLESDRERAESVRALFGRSIDDLMGYDLVINTSCVAPAGAAAIIIAAVKEHFRG